MVSISISRPALTLFVALVALLSVSASAEEIHKDVCYEKWTKCCYKFAPCGFVSKTVVLKPRCDFEKCDKVCKPVCKMVHKAKPKTVCGHHGCHIKVLHFEENICNSVCNDVCKVVKAVCVKFQVFQQTKFCAKVECGKEEVEGSTVAPGDFVGKEKKLVKVIPGSRKIIDDGHGVH